MKEIGSKLVSRNLIETFRKYFAEIPDKMTAKEAVKYAIYCKALEGEASAYKALGANIDKPIDRRF